MTLVTAGGELHPALRTYTANIDGGADYGDNPDRGNPRLPNGAIRLLRPCLQDSHCEKTCR